MLRDDRADGRGSARTARRSRTALQPTGSAYSVPIAGCSPGTLPDAASDFGTSLRRAVVRECGPRVGAAGQLGVLPLAEYAAKIHRPWPTRASSAWEDSHSCGGLIPDD